MRSQDGLLKEYESAGLREQRWGNRALEKGVTTGGERGEGILLGLLTRSQDGENALHEATATLTRRAITGLAPLHGMPQRTLGSVIGFLNVGYPHERPERAFFG